MQQNKGNLLALGSIPLMMTLGNSMLIPVLPEIGRKLHVSSFRISMLITVYAVVAILLIPIAGYLSDRFGRKAVIVPCLILTVIGGGFLQREHGCFTIRQHTGPLLQAVYFRVRERQGLFL